MNDNLNALPLGTELNHYVIEAVLGSGGFGIVYKAHHAHLDEQVVIKEFLPVELAGRHGNTVAPHGTSKQEVYSECLRRFMEEGRTLVKLRHPNVVRCRDLFTANGTAYLVMDFEDGLPLDELVRSLEAQGSRYTEQQLLHFLLPLADGLAYIHSQGVLHRDIKPANVFIRRSDGSPVIIDFGAAKQNFALASQSQAPFTEFYAPLEQIEGGGEAKPTVDIHAFGGLMYRLATGQMGPKAEARAMALVYGKPDPLQPAALLAQGQYSQPFLSTIDQCLAFKANERPQTMREVAQRLAQSGAQPQAEKNQTQTTLSALDDLIALAGADGVIHDTEMTMLLNKASSLGIGKDKAQQYIETAIKQAPKHPDVLDTYGKVLMKRDKLADAVKAFEQSLAVRPDSNQVKLHYAEALALSGSKDKARASQPMRRGSTMCSRPAATPASRRVPRCRVLRKNWSWKNPTAQPPFTCSARPVSTKAPSSSRSTMAWKSSTNTSTSKASR